ncbi:MAG: DUF1800 domain-containing protein [Nibricoccus sp.]
MDTATTSSTAQETPGGKQSASEAWQPLPPDQWDEAAARHLLFRTTWSAQPAEVTRATKEGLQPTLNRLFPPQAEPFPTPKLVADLQEDTPEFTQKIRAATPEEKRMLQKEARDRSQQAFSDMAVRWLQFAADPQRSAFEKWVLFLSDIYVVSFEKVRNAALIHDHFGKLREYALGPAPHLTKAISRSPAMIQYLDLQESKKDAPNENFARELFELFVLGEGNYTEADIKQAARAFTGYRRQYGTFRFAQNQHDTGKKTVFGHTGNFDGDEVIDLAYKQPAAARFVPNEMVKFYLSETPLPPETVAELGDWWRSQKFNLRALAHRFFGSRAFFDSAGRGNFIKSPVQFYLGLVQDLQLDVAPLPRRVLGSLRQMGQNLFTPPNVRGWVGGRNWINSSTFSARRQLVQTLFYPINEANLNADEQAELARARDGGRTRFTVDPDWLKKIAKDDAPSAAEQVIATFLPTQTDGEVRRKIADFIGTAPSPNQRVEKTRSAIIALLQSPEYQLC